jgi:hypothetical protein
VFKSPSDTLFVHKCPVRGMAACHRDPGFCRCGVISPLTCSFLRCCFGSLGAGPGRGRRTGAVVQSRRRRAAGRRPPRAGRTLPSPGSRSADRRLGRARCRRRGGATADERDRDVASLRQPQHHVGPDRHRVVALRNGKSAAAARPKWLRKNRAHREKTLNLTSPLDTQAPGMSFQA